MIFGSRSPAEVSNNPGKARRRVAGRRYYTDPTIMPRGSAERELSGEVRAGAVSLDKTQQMRLYVWGFVMCLVIALRVFFQHNRRVDRV